MAYSKAVMDHFLHPRHAGVMEKSDPDVGSGCAGSQAQGALVQIQLRVSEAGLIDEACFKAYGCGCTIAAASLSTELLRGLSLEQAPHVVDHERLQTELDLPALKIHCSLLAQEAVQAAVDDARKRLEARRAVTSQG